MFEFFYSKLCKKLFPRLYDELYQKVNQQVSADLSQKLSNDLYAKLNTQFRNDYYQKWENELYTNLSDGLHNDLYQKLYRQLSNDLYAKLNTQLRNDLYQKWQNELYANLSNSLHNDLSKKLHHHLFINLREPLHDELYRNLKNQLHSEVYRLLLSELQEALRAEIAKGGSSSEHSFKKQSASDDIRTEQHYHATIFTSIFNEGNKNWLDRLRGGDKVSFKLISNGRQPTMQVWTGFGILGKLPIEEANYFDNDYGTFSLGYICCKEILDDDIGYRFIIVIPYTTPRNGRISPVNQDLEFDDDKGKGLFFSALSEAENYMELEQDNNEFMRKRMEVDFDMEVGGWSRIENEESIWPSDID
ncbi:hypothetical protein KA012_03565 [Candidatus Woesebacteria bacterium]|nr:hypothetical protein [Candidatus Woesebacteria bacterium]